MAGRPERARETDLERGWTDLREGRWGPARSAFEQALASEETPQALEGLSWAAWWLDDEATVFAARERAFALYRARDDAAGAARMATWLAVDEIDFRGALSVASGWLRRAHRLLDSLEPGPDHGWLAFHDGYLARIRDDNARAVELAAQAADLGRRFEVPDLEMLGLALEGLTLVSGAKVDEGMRCLDEATVLALEGEAVVPISSAWACCFMVSACTAAHDYERAFEWCDRIAEFAERYGSRYMFGFCRAEYGAIHLWRGRWRDAEDVFEASIEDFSRSRQAMSGAPLAGLAELRRRQGRRADAERLLDDAGASSSTQICRARLALDAGDSRQALEIAERLRRQLSEQAALELVPIHELLVRARVAQGEPEQAVADVQALREMARRVGTAPLRGRAELAAGILGAAQGRHDEARTALEDAIDCFETSGAPFDAAQARLELAIALVALGREADGRREAESALETLVALGAEGEATRARQLLRDQDRSSGTAAEVTPRERDVLALLVEGLTNREIAARLVVSEHTVHRHVTNLLRKLELPSRTAAAAYAVRSGLVDRTGAQ